MNLYDIFRDIYYLFTCQDDIEQLRDNYQQINNMVMNIMIHLGDISPYETNFPILTDKQIDEISKTIINGQYPAKLTPLVDKLYQYMGPEFLSTCAQNLTSVSVIKSKKYKPKQHSIFDQSIVGKWDPVKNNILYYDDRNLSHELLHMASSPRENNATNTFCSGFRLYFNTYAVQTGLDEGYTELLDRRIFFDGDYNTDALYKPNVYILRMFELLYASYRNMERDYFLANVKGPISNFTNFGSIEEYFKLQKYLDWFASTEVIENEDIEMLEFMEEIITRTYDDGKIIKAKEIKEEFLKTEDKKTNKIFSLTKKHR